MKRDACGWGSCFTYFGYGKFALVILLAGIGWGTCAGAVGEFSTNGITIVSNSISGVAVIANGSTVANEDKVVSIGQLSGVYLDGGTNNTLYIPDLLSFAGQSFEAYGTNGNSSVYIDGNSVSAGEITLSSGNTNHAPVILSQNPTNGVFQIEGNMAGDASGLTVNGGELLETVLDDLQQQAGAVYSNAVSITVQVTNHEITNGVNLITAYANAAAMNPSASNRVAIIVPPGRYDLGTAGLMLDTSYVDIIGSSTDRDIQYLYGMPAADNGVIGQSADHVRIENLMVVNLSTASVGDFPPLAAVAYYPTTPGSNTVVRNCEFSSASGYTMCIGEYAGLYENCIAGDFSFAGGIFDQCTASGTFIDCTGGSYSFGGGASGTASGRFINCKAGMNSFGAFALPPDGSVFVHCSAGPYSLGSLVAVGDYNQNAFGYIFKGGPVSGDGSGLTNINLSTSTGMLSLSQLPELTVEQLPALNVSKLPTDGDWETSGLTIGQLRIDQVSGAAGRQISTGAAHYYYKPVFENGIVSFEALARKDGVVQALCQIAEDDWRDELGGPVVDFVESPCLILGAGDYIQFDDLSGVTNVENAGTAVFGIDDVSHRLAVTHGVFI